MRSALHAIFDSESVYLLLMAGQHQSTVKRSEHDNERLPAFAGCSAV